MTKMKADFRKRIWKKSSTSRQLQAEQGRLAGRALVGPEGHPTTTTMRAAARPVSNGR
jgi:hypothetical protein